MADGRTAGAPRGGTAVPISLPSSSELLSPNLSILKNLRAHASHLQRKVDALTKLARDTLMDISDEPRWETLVPVPGNTSASAGCLGYARGEVVNTNTVLVSLGGSSAGREGGEEAHGGYVVEYSAKQARGVAQRKKAVLQEKIMKVKDAIRDVESALSSEMGFSGGSINEEFELLNEEGLPFMDIQEFEEDDAASSTPSASVSAASRPATSTSASLDCVPESQSAAKAAEVPQTAPVPAMKQSAGKTEESATSSQPVKAKKRVSFGSGTKPPASIPSPSSENLPTISTPGVQASSSGQSSVSRTKAEATPIDPRPYKNTIVERPVKAPPPLLTAAERSIMKNGSTSSAPRKQKGLNGLDRDAEIMNKAGRPIDLSAYLPKTLRKNGTEANGVQSKGKGKQRAIESEVGPDDWENADMTAGVDEDDLELDDEDEEDAGRGKHNSNYDLDSPSEDDEDDSDDYFDDEDEEEDDGDNVHIDDILAMREAALEYHAKRYNLGAGAGSGPLGGSGKPDEFDEPGLSLYDKGGLPIVETDIDEEGESIRGPSKFRSGRLQTARMIIPSLAPGSEVDIASSLLPGDELGPFVAPEAPTGPEGQAVNGKEEEEEIDEATANDLKGMSKEEIATFLRYVKALETGENLDDLSIVPKRQEEEEAAAEREKEWGQADDFGRSGSAPQIKSSMPKDVEPIKAVVQEKPVAKAPPAAAPIAVPSNKPLVSAVKPASTATAIGGIVGERKTGSAPPPPVQDQQPKRVSRFRSKPT